MKSMLERDYPQIVTSNLTNYKNVYQDLLRSGIGKHLDNNFSSNDSILDLIKPDKRISLLKHQNLYYLTPNVRFVHFDSNWHYFVYDDKNFYWLKNTLELYNDDKTLSEEEMDKKLEILISEGYYRIRSHKLKIGTVLSLILSNKLDKITPMKF